ncbi:hypothetical protein [Paraburkholderia sacchari]|nr:hypothetical protein [Paraburkholderia sacchari]
MAGRVQIDYRDDAQTPGPLYGIAPELLAPPQRVAELLRATVQ